MKILNWVLSSDGVAMKYLQKTSDGLVIEATYIKRPKKHTICVSIQVGCMIGCRFCTSGLRSEGLLYQRSLTSAEMVEECCSIAQKIDFTAHPKPLTLAFMGEGEPFLNFDACVEAFHTLSVMGWPVPMQLSVSTSGIRPDLIRRFAEITFPVRLKLQVSLHAPSDDIRSKIVPITEPVSEIVAAVRTYWEKCGRPVIWNYVMCDGLNDKLEHAEQLVKLLGFGWQMKFTRLNFTAGSPFRPASRGKVERFRRVLEDNGLFTTYSETDESGIQSGCGQLSYHYV